MYFLPVLLRWMFTADFHPGVFRALNTIRLYGEKDRAQSYYEKLTQTSGKAGDCIQCGQCESV